MKKIFYILGSILIVIGVIYACTKDFDDNIAQENDDVVKIHLQNIKIHVTTLKSTGAVPDDQDTLYVTFRRYHGDTIPAFVFKLSPIPEEHTFELPKWAHGYDVFICTYPNKLFKVAETWDMPKHLWTFQQEDVGHGGTDDYLNVQLKRLSSNFIVRGKEGTAVPPNVTGVQVFLDAVFNNYHPVWGVSFGLYERKYVDLWPVDNNEFLFENKCMGMKDLDSLGTFVFIICRENDYCRYYTYRHELIIQGGKSTILEVDLDNLGTADWKNSFTWLDEEEEIIIPIN